MRALEELALRSDQMEAVILPDAGGRLHRLRAFGHDLLRTPDDPASHQADPFSWGAYVMAPWCNRAAPGRRELAGREIDLAPNFPDGTAIHGLVSSARWELRGHGQLHCRRDAGTDWPWAFEVAQTATLNGPALSVELRLTNLDSAPMPAGLGLHPWFRRPLEARVPAERVYASNRGSDPRPSRVRGDHDLRELGTPASGLDGTWTALVEPRVELAWPGLRIRATLDMETDAAAILVAVATPRAADAIAVEPQTHGPDPLRRLAAAEPDPPALLPPGASMRLSLRLSVGAYR